MTRLKFDPEPALRSVARLHLWRHMRDRLVRSACVAMSLSVPYLVFLSQTHAH